MDNEIKPDTSAANINRLLNDPSVYPMVKGPHIGDFEMSRLIGHPQHTIISCSFGGMIFICHQPGVYELHSAFLPEGRNATGRDWGKRVIDWFFTHTDAFEILTKCPHNNPGAKAAAMMMGFVQEWVTPPMWPHDGDLYPVDVCSLKIEKWSTRAHNMAAVGKAFHAELHAIYEIKGIKVDTHDEDVWHDMYAGIAVSMMPHLPFKAADFYNRWAVMNGYAKITIEDLNPLTINIVESRLRIYPDRFEVL